MTRINLVPVTELSDQHLLAEYRELPRVLKQNINTKDAPTLYKLGSGHVKWAKRYSKFVYYRFYELVDEMQYRGFKTTFTEIPKSLVGTGLDYTASLDDLLVSTYRLVTKYREKPSFYRWTKRNKPNYMKLP